MMDASKEVKDLEHPPSAAVKAVAESDQDRDSSIASRDDDGGKAPIPLNMKIISVIVVSMIGFGGHWSSGVTGALKSTLKKVCLVPLSLPNHP
jgi:hypothetical protein